MAALDLAALGAAQIAGTLDNARTVLTTLAARQRLRAGEPIRCDPELTDLLWFNARFTNIVLADTTGRVVRSEAELPAGRLTTVRETLDQPQPQQPAAAALR